MRYEYFGIMIKPLGLASGQVQVLARVVNGVRDLQFEPRSEFEPTGHVFVDKIAEKWKGARLFPVTFEAEPNPKPSRQDQMWISHGQDGKPKLDLHGFAILDAVTSLEDIHDPKPKLRSKIQLVNEVQLYLRYTSSVPTRLRGPWLVRDGTLVIPAYGQWEWDDSCWPKGSHFRADNESYEVLLAQLEPTLGVPIDTVTDEALADWFVKQVQVQEIADIIGRLNRKGMSLLKSRIRDLANSADREKFERRFEKIWPALESLDFGVGQLDEIARSRAFEPLWKRAVQQRSVVLEEEAEAQAGKMTARVSELAVEVKRLERQYQAEVSRHEKERSKRIREEDKLANARRDAQELERYVGDNQNRLLNDVRALLPLHRGSSLEVPTQKHRSSLLPAFRPGNSAVEPPTLDAATIAACRLTLLSEPFIARSVAAAQGRKLYLLQAEPHWLCFEDSWGSGLRQIFEEAVQGEVNILLHIQDLDRSPPELWLRPVLDLASGLRDMLIENHENWPKGLRITASLAPGPPQHPLDAWLLGHFAAAAARQGDSTEFANPQVGAAIDEFMRAEQAELELRLLELSRPTCDDPDRLERIQDRARNIRRVWPLTFRRR